MESYHYYMMTNFFTHIDINPENAHILDGNAADLQVECEKYEKLIKEAGGVDLFVGGEFLSLGHIISGYRGREAKPSSKIITNFYEYFVVKQWHIYNLI